MLEVDHGEGELVCPIREETDPSFSQPVPKLTPALEREGDIDFLMNTIDCLCKEMSLENMNRILSTGPGERGTVVHSPLFVHHGYTLCLHVALCRNNNIAIGITIMKGAERDKHLVWPFNMIVVLRLKNQSGGQDRTKMFRCEKNGSRLKNSLMRPKTDMNSPIGYPNFISSQCLLKDGFVRNNSMHLNCYLFPRDAKIRLASEYPSIIR